MNCPYCKTNKEYNDVPLGDKILRSYSCGHGEFVEPIQSPDYFSADKSKNFEARQYQKEGVDFILESDCSCLIGDQMRLGKTPQALLAAKNAKERRPILILVRSANLHQWIREYKTWTSTLPLGIFPIHGSKSFIPPGFDAYIISMDTLGRGDMVKRLLEFGFKLVIADEAHSFKNRNSKRTQALIQFLHEISKKEITYEVPFTCFNCREQWTETVVKIVDNRSNTISKTAYCPSCNSYNNHITQLEKIAKRTRKCAVIFLTGTAIKNRAEEYFVPLNILAPEKFPNFDRFKRDWLEQDSQGKWSRINRYRIESFKEVIKPLVLRREKEDVFKDLPALNRTFSVIEVEDERLKAAYNKLLDKLERDMEENPNFTFFQHIGELMMLRQICGMAKVPFITDYVGESIESKENSKIAIGIHHHSVRDSLAYNLEQFGVLKLSGEDSPERKDFVMRSFETDKNHACVINMVAGGVGMDFHYCDSAIIAERMWSSADEEQFEFRFYNPDKKIMGENHSANIEYVLAKGTIDEWFHNMIEKKRVIFGETISNNWNLESDPGSFKELLEQTVSNRL